MLGLKCECRTHGQLIQWRASSRGTYLRTGNKWKRHLRFCKPKQVRTGQHHVSICMLVIEQEGDGGQECLRRNPSNLVNTKLGQINLQACRTIGKQHMTQVSQLHAQTTSCSTSSGKFVDTHRQQEGRREQSRRIPTELCIPTRSSRSCGAWANAKRDLVRVSVTAQWLCFSIASKLVLRNQRTCTDHRIWANKLSDDSLQHVDGISQTSRDCEP